MSEKAQHEHSPSPLEELMEVNRKQKQITIGIPKELVEDESRIPITPEAVELLTASGLRVIIESGAGDAADYKNLDYAESGANIVENRSEVFESDIILKVAPFTLAEIELLKKQQLIISSFQMPKQSEEALRRLMQKKVTAIAFEFLQDDLKNLPVVQVMSEIAGSAAIMIASEYLSNAHSGKGVLLGGITGISATEVVILGAGTAGEFAARSALALGASVKIFDHSITSLRNIQNKLGQRVFTSIYHPRVLLKALKSADVVIGDVDLIDPRHRFVVSEEMVEEMKPGSVIIDLSIDQGGCFETSKPATHQNPVFVKHGIIHYCVPNIPSRVARTATIALSNIFSPLLLELNQVGGIKEMLKDNLGVRHGVYLYNGILTNKFIAKKYGIRGQDIDLLMAVFND